MKERPENRDKRAHDGEELREAIPSNPKPAPPNFLATQTPSVTLTHAKARRLVSPLRLPLRFRSRRRQRSPGSSRRRRFCRHAGLLRSLSPLLMRSATSGQLALRRTFCLLVLVQVQVDSSLTSMT